MSLLARVQVALILIVLVGCGGGGGGGTAPSGGGNSTARGQFVLSESTASFDLLQNTDDTRRLQLTITGRDVAYVGAAYTGGQTQPSWLAIDITGAGSNYEVVLAVNSYLPAGTYSSTFSVGTADSATNILQSKPITVTLTVEPRIELSGSYTDYSFTYGAEIATQDMTFQVTAPNKQWHATSNAAWLSVPSSAQNNSGAFTATVDVDSLTPGTYTAELTVANDSRVGDTAVLEVSVTVEPPGLTAQYPLFVFGGEDGLSFDTHALNMSLNTGNRAHPFTIELHTDSGGEWLQSSVASGFVGGSGAVVDFTAVPGTLLGGTYTGEIVLNITVDELLLTHRIPATLNIEANRLVVGTAGVMLSSSPAPGRSLLTRDVTVHSSIDRTDVPWSASASSDQSWLTVTASGTTGQDLRLMADPAGLTPDTTHIATVIITSSDPTVENQQSIRVGLYINSAAPMDVSLPDEAFHLAASQVEPIVFASAGGPDIIGYNVFTGTVERTFSNAVATGGVMTMSDDGLRLFVYDTTNLAVTELDATTGAFVQQYAHGTFPSSGRVGGLAYFRPDGHEVLVTPSSYMHELSSGDAYELDNFTAPRSAASLTHSHDHRYLVADYGSAYRLKRSALNGGEMIATHTLSTGTAQGREGQACMSADGTMLYTASGYPYNFPGTSMQTHEVTQVLPADAYPNSIVCLWNGVIIGGIDGYYETYDIWVYEGPTGQELANVSSTAGTGAYRSLRERGIAVSADATRMIAISGAGPYNATPEMRFQSIPEPN